MKLKCDSNNFIIGLTTDDNSFSLGNGEYEVTINSIQEMVIFDNEYNYPLYQYIDNEIVPRLNELIIKQNKFEQMLVEYIEWCKNRPRL